MMCFEGFNTHINHLPIIQISVLFHSRCNVLADIWEKAIMRDTFHLCYGVDVEISRIVSFRVLANETDAFGFSVHTCHNLEESFRNRYVVMSYCLMLLPIEDRAADDIDVSVLFCPATALLFNVVPIPAIQSGMLRADV